MPKISWNNFKTKFNGREQEMFEFLSYILFLREFNQPHGVERYKDQAGIETEPIQFEGKWIGFQAKFYDTKISDHTSKIKEGIEKAKRKNPHLEKIYFYLNQEFSESSEPNEKEPKYKTEIEKYAKSQKVEVVWRVPSHFEAQLYIENNKDLERDFFNLTAKPEFDEATFESYLKAVKSFSERTPYLALNQMLSESAVTMDDVYIPLSVQISGNIQTQRESEVINASSSVSQKENASNPNEPSGQNIAPPPQLLSSFAEAIKISRKDDHKKHILLQGAAGAGKSTVLHSIAKDAWENPTRLGLDKPHLPLIIRLRVLATIQESSFESKLLQSIQRGGDIEMFGKIPEDFFSEWSREKSAPWLVMLDGFDEAPTNDRAKLIQWVESFIGAIKNDSHLIVLTSRLLSAQPFQNRDYKFLICDLLDLNSEQRKEFAMRWFSENAEDFLMKVERFSQPRDVFHEKLNMTPLLLTIAAVVYKRTGDLPITGQNELYENFINILFDEATKRGLKDELGVDLFSIAQVTLERLALEMTDNSENNSFSDLSKICSKFVAESLGYSQIRSRTEGERLCEVLTLRSGVLQRQGDICLWGHATMREYLAARGIIHRLEDENGDFELVIGERILDAKNYEMLLAFSRNYEDRRALLHWMCRWARQKTSASAARLAYEVWDESEEALRLDSHEDIIIALASAFGEYHIDLSLEDGIEDVLIKTGEVAVNPLLTLLDEYNTLQNIDKHEEAENSQESSEQSSEFDEKLYGAYRIRAKIIKVLGDIGDERAIEPIIEMLPIGGIHERYHYELSEAARKALSCIGRSTIALLLPKIKNSSLSVERRCAYIGGLITVGIRTQEVSKTLSEILREGLNNCEKLLARAIATANKLRDREQGALIKNALESENLEVIELAATYFSIMPDSTAIESLNAAFEKYSTSVSERNYELSRTVKSLATALINSEKEESRKLVVRYLENNLRVDGILYPQEAVDIFSQSNIPGVPDIFLKEFIQQLKAPKPDYVVDDLLGEIAQMWEPSQLESLSVVTAAELSQVQEKNNFVAKLIALRGKKPKTIAGKISPIGERIDNNEIIRTMANCRVPDFALQSTRLFSNDRFSYLNSLYRTLWIAADISAEPFLLDKLRRLFQKWKPKSPEFGNEGYYIIRALATCCTKKGADVIIDFVREYPDLYNSLPSEVIIPLVKRKTIGVDIISRMALDRSGTHEYVRNFCLQCLAMISVPQFTDVLVNALENETYERARSYAAYALRFTGEKQKKQVIEKLEKILNETSRTDVASDAGSSLVQLNSVKSLKLIENTILRFGGVEQMPRLTRSVAKFKASSTFELLRDFEDNDTPQRYIHYDQYLISALGEYYETEKKARELVKKRFESSYENYDLNRQRTAVSVLAKYDANYLLKCAVDMYDSGTLEESAILEIIKCAEVFKDTENLNQNDFTELYTRFLCAENLDIRERAGESLNLIGDQLRQKIYDHLKTISEDWVRGCLVYSLAFWDSQIEEIKQAQFDESKIVRHFADVAIKIREKRQDLKQVSEIFQATEDSAQRVAAFSALANQITDSQLDDLYRSINHDHPMRIFLRSLGQNVERRIKNEREKREKFEKENFCNKIRRFTF